MNILLGEKTKLKGARKRPCPYHQNGLEKTAGKQTWSWVVVGLDVGWITWTEWYKWSDFKIQNVRTLMNSVSNNKLGGLQNMSIPLGGRIALFTLQWCIYYARLGAKCSVLQKDTRSSIPVTDATLQERENNPCSGSRTWKHEAGIWRLAMTLETGKLNQILFKLCQQTSKSKSVPLLRNEPQARRNTVPASKMPGLYYPPCRLNACQGIVGGSHTNTVLQGLGCKCLGTGSSIYHFEVA